jgi:hypothetical protein
VVTGVELYLARNHWEMTECKAVLLDLFIFYLPVYSKNHMFGSFGPMTKVHESLTPEEDTPGGLISRGNYIVKSQFIDDDKTIILEWEWTFEIKKDFK